MNYQTKQYGLLTLTRKRLLLCLGGVMLIFLLMLSRMINVNSIGWISGFNHPLEGWDHLLTMLAVGIWAAQLRGQAVWLLPLSFVGVMSLGGLAGTIGISIPSVEIIVLLSGIVFSFLITRKVRFNTKVNVLIVAFFAFFHGYAHGQEISTSASLFSYTLGFMVATLLLHGVGILTARIIVVAFAVVFAGNAYADSMAKMTDAKVSALASGEHYKLDLKYKALKRIDLVIEGQAKTKYEQRFSDNLVPEDSGQLKKSQKLSVTKGQVCSVDLMVNLNRYHQLTREIFQAKLGLNFLEDKKSVVDFSKYYPDINNTPGISYLTNGVGANSPPIIVSTTANFPALPIQSRNTVFEEFALQAPSCIPYPSYTQKQIYSRLLSASRSIYQAAFGGIACRSQNVDLTYREAYG
jgi:urease accessory protein